MRKRSEVAAAKAASPSPLPSLENPNRALDLATRADQEAKGSDDLVFLSANREPPAGASFHRITERIFSVDVLADYDRLERDLKIGSGRMDYGILLKALDEAEDNARLAHKLFLSAKVERALWDADAEVIKSAMWAQARKDLEDEKTVKVEGRKKQITDADVSAKCAEMFPEDWKRLIVRAKKYKGAEEHLERLADLWQARCRSLQTMVSTLRR